MIIKINRNGNYQTYEINNIEDRTTILEVLEQIKNYQDPSLSYRAQCRASICGTCAVKVNSQTVLACKTKVKDLAVNDEIVIEPLSNMPVIKDLVVDHDEFLNKLKKAKAWFIPKEPFEKVYPEDLATYDRETDCILCGICYSVCPGICK
jgi:Succinate dehydrogenase/fumarate reductase, Fe-S protein subunit